MWGNSKPDFGVKCAMLQLYTRSCARCGHAFLALCAIVVQFYTCFLVVCTLLQYFTLALVHSYCKGLAIFLTCFQVQALEACMGTQYTVLMYF